MKYIVMMFGDQATMVETRSTEWIRGMIKFMQGLEQELKDSGELVDSQGLADPTQAKTVRYEGGVPVVTDGPFAEAKESLAGYWIIEATEERALQFASRVVAFIEGPIEVRQVMSEPPAEFTA
ncbi:MAG TPA: YciI family protein [Actinomycetota bacterium]|nr:YciI family protein [Actinomycetota bacterium]